MLPENGRAGPGSPVIVTFSTDVFRLDAVKRAAYSLSGRATINISIEGKVISCQLIPIGEQATVVSDFKREVLDYELRASIAAETEAIRNAVLAFAISKAGIQDGG